MSSDLKTPKLASHLTEAIFEFITNKELSFSTKELVLSMLLAYEGIIMKRFDVRIEDNEEWEVIGRE